MPRPGLVPNQSYNQRMLGFSLRVDRPGGRVVRPRLRMSGTINPLLLYASMMWKRITLNIYMYVCVYVYIYIYISLWGSRQSALYSRKPGSITEMCHEHPAMPQNFRRITPRRGGKIEITLFSRKKTSVCV